MANADILLNWSALPTGLLDKNDLPDAMEAENLVESDPTCVYSGAGSNYTHTYIEDDQGNSPEFPFDVTINGVTSRPVGTKWLAFDLSINSAQEDLWLTFHGGVDENWYNLIKAGFIKVEIGDPPAISQVNFDHSQIQGPFSIPQLRMQSNGTNVWYSHSQMNGGASDNGSQFAATNGVFFYQLFRDLTNGLHKIKFYDPSNNYEVVGESQSTLGDELWSYRDYWMNWYNGSVGPQDAKLWFGPTVYIYDPVDFIALDPSLGTLNVTTLNAMTLTVG